MRIVLLLLFVFPVLLSNAQDKGVQLDSFFTNLSNNGKFYGNVLIAEKGKVLYEKSFGLADRVKNTALNSESVFELASVSKQFTAMGIMLLQKQGKLSYDDSLRKFFPELPYHHITVRQLLQHTSGLPDYMQLFGQKWDTTRIATNADVIKLLATEKPAIGFTPGTKWEYSNTGYALLSSIIEKVSGQSFPAYLEKNIFKPLGMKRTSVVRRRFEKNVPSNYAFGYIKDQSGEYKLPDDIRNTAQLVYCLDGITGDGTVNSTTGDLLKWDRALYTNKLLDQKMIAEAFEPGMLNDGAKTAYGYGWQIGKIHDSTKSVRHSGGWPGYSTFIERHIDNDRTIIILSNHNNAPTYLGEVRDILYGIKREKPAAVKVSSAKFKDYAGEYELMPGFVLTVSPEGDQLFTQATGQGKVEIFAEKEDHFFLKVVEAKLRFNRDEKGQVKSVTLFQSGQELEGKKIK